MRPINAFVKLVAVRATDLGDPERFGFDSDERQPNREQRRPFSLPFS